MPDPAYTRLDVEERRRRLLALGTELFTRHAYNDLSMARIAREAGISKPLLYHYFPSKHAYFVATLSQAADELRARTEPDPALPPFEQLRASLHAFLAFIEERATAYAKLMETASSVSEVRETVEQVRRFTAARILDGLLPGVAAPPVARAAVAGWLWFMDGACLDWIEHGDFDRAALADMLLGTLVGALGAATGGEPAAATAGPGAGGGRRADPPAGSG